MTLVKLDTPSAFLQGESPTTRAPGYSCKEKWEFPRAIEETVEEKNPATPLPRYEPQPTIRVELCHYTSVSQPWFHEHRSGFHQTL